MTLKYVLTAALAGAMAFNAGATTTNWETHNTAEVGVGLLPPGAFEDTFSFTLDTDGVVKAAAVANNLNPTFDILSGTVTLYREAGDNDTAVGSFSFDGTTGSITHDFSTLTAGSDYYEVTGTAQGTQGGFYSLASNVAAVPEPGTVALLGSGVLTMGALYRRRRPS